MSICQIGDGVRPRGSSGWHSPSCPSSSARPSAASAGMCSSPCPRSRSSADDGRSTRSRAAPALLLPLLLTTLERALQYGESLDARGFGSGRRSRYRPFHWTAADLLVVIASLAAIVVIALLPVVAYNPYVDLVPAAPDPDRLLAVGLLAVPAVIAGLLTADHARHHA